VNPVDQHPGKQDGFKKGECRKEREGRRSKERNAKNEPMLALNARLLLFPLTIGAACSARERRHARMLEQTQARRGNGIAPG
jgi:hypothetical protein